MTEDNTKPQFNTLNVNEADGWEIRRVYKTQRRYTSIATIRMANNQVTEPDLLDLLGELSKGARDLFLDIKRAMKYQTHTAELPNKGLNQSQINKRSKAA